MQKPSNGAKGIAELIETPNDKLDNLALVNEVLVKRQEEANDLRVQISNLRHTVQQERIQWDEQRRQEEAVLKMKALKLEQQVAEKFANADQLVTARLDAFQQAENERKAAVKERMVCQDERRQLGDLNMERVEVERFRVEVDRKHIEASSRFSEAQAVFNTANQRHESTKKMLAEIERRTAELDSLRNILDTKKEELDVRSKHLNRVQEVIGKEVEKLPVPEKKELPPLPPSPEQPPMTQIKQGGVVESPPAETISDKPEIPSASDLTGDVEIAKQVSPSAQSPSQIVLPGAPSTPYVHPSQRRVMDGGKPINEQ